MRGASLGRRRNQLSPPASQLQITESGELKHLLADAVELDVRVDLDRYGANRGVRRRTHGRLHDRTFRYAEACSSNEKCRRLWVLRLATASALRWWTRQFPCRKTGTWRLPPDRIPVAAKQFRQRGPADRPRLLPWPPEPSPSQSARRRGSAEGHLQGRRRAPQGSGRYAGRLLSRPLCQGAALHYVNESNGVKDFDVWSFYAQYNDWPFPARWRGTRDFGPSNFGRYPGDPARYSGRRVDLLGAFAARPNPADSA